MLKRVFLEGVDEATSILMPITFMPGVLLERRGSGCSLAGEVAAPEAAGGFVSPQ